MSWVAPTFTTSHLNLISCLHTPSSSPSWDTISHIKRISVSPFLLVVISSLQMFLSLSLSLTLSLLLLSLTLSLLSHLGHLLLYLFPLSHRKIHLSILWQCNLFKHVETSNALRWYLWLFLLKTRPWLTFPKCQLLYRN